jgi:outer membrane protein assembly factor BamA
MFISSSNGKPDFYLIENDSLPPARLTDLYMTPQFPSRADSSGVVLFQSADWSGSGLYISHDLVSRRVHCEDSLHICRQRDLQIDSLSGLYEPLNWMISPYQPALSLDQVSANAGFDSYSGLTGNSYFLFSDILGRHQMGIIANFSGQVTDLDAAVLYSNLAHRIQTGGAVYRFASRYVFEDSMENREYVRDISLGANLNAQYPFTKSLRTGLSSSYRRVSREGLWSNDMLFRENIFSIRANLVYDNALWGAVGPRVGNRMSIDFDYAPGFWDNASYFTGMLDLRNYTWVSSEVTLATRLAGGMSFGEDKQRFFLGGVLPHRRSTGDVEGVGDLYQFYASYSDLLRGWDYVSLNGTRYGVASIELRYPILNYLSLAAPIPMTFYRGRGVIFTDLGFVSDDLSSFKGARGNGGYRLQDIKMSIGTGFRLNVGFFVLMSDIAWRTDLSGISRKPEYYFTLATEF